MAGDWIKMEVCTPEKSEVLAITARMGWDDADITVGKLFRVWRWFDQHTTNGNAAGVTSALLDRIVGVTGFCHAMESVGWLVINSDGLSLPNFDWHNGKSAKSRAQGAKRASNFKSNAKSNGGSVTTALPREEKRREDVVVTAKADATVVELRPEQQQAGLHLNNPTGFARRVAEAYAAAYGVDVPPVPLMTAMSIVQRIDFYPATAELSWWEVYFQLCFEDLYLTNRESLDQPLGRKAARFNTLISEKTISAMVDRNNREAAHA